MESLPRSEGLEQSAKPSGNSFSIEVRFFEMRVAASFIASVSIASDGCDVP
jgi:hypothetical protein